MLTRRRFACGLGLSAALAPFGSLLSGRSAAQPSGPQAKYLCLISTTGSNPQLWSPSGPLFNESNAPLQRVADDLVLVSGQSGNGNCAQHGSPGGLTGIGYSGRNQTSIDQFVARRLAERGESTPISNLILGSNPTEQRSTFWRDGQALDPISSPMAAFDTVFAGAPPSMGSTPMPDSESSELLRRRLSILDAMQAELEALSASVGAEERQKLELHAQSIRDLENRLMGQASTGNQTSTGGCEAPLNVADTGQVLTDCARCLEVGISAMACDITRVVAVEFGHHQSTQVSLPGMAEGDWHGGYLHSNQVEDLTKLEAWICERFVGAIEMAKARPAPDGNGSLFDQTLFVWARTMGDSVAHNDEDMRTILVGGGGALRTAAGGRHVNAAGESHQRSLLAAASILGIADFSGYGNESLGGQSREPLDEVLA